MSPWFLFQSSDLSDCLCRSLLSVAAHGHGCCKEVGKNSHHNMYFYIIRQVVTYPVIIDLNNNMNRLLGSHYIS